MSREAKGSDERGSVAVLMSDALQRGDADEAARLLESLGDLQLLVERDGAVEQLPRLVGLALRAGRGDLVVGLHSIDAEGTPLRRIISTHVAGLVAAAEGRRDQALALLTSAANSWQAFGNLSEAHAARRDLLDLTG